MWYIHKSSGAYNLDIYNFKSAVGVETQTRWLRILLAIQRIYLLLINYAFARLECWGCRFDSRNWTIISGVGELASLPLISALKSRLTGVGPSWTIVPLFIFFIIIIFICIIYFFIKRLLVFICINIFNN